MPNPNAQQQGQDFANAAVKYKVPLQVLFGVYGIETNYGNNQTTSSAGAKGPTQFLELTAQHYNYPYTNTPNAAQFSQQIDATARYLSDLYKVNGNSWDAAIHLYSGGGYTYADVQKQFDKSPPSLVDAALHATVTPALQGNAPPDTTVTGGFGTNTIPDALNSIGQTFTGIFNQAVGDLKYGVVLLAALAVAVMLVTHGVRGSGGEGRKVVPIPV